MEEFEIKFLEVNVPELEKKLLGIGAKKVAEYDYSRTIFYFPERKNEGWVRLRTDGKETTLTYKESIKEKLADGTLTTTGMKEIEIVVDDYNRAYEFVLATGLVFNKQEKNKRIRYIKGDVTFDIDFWPQIPTYLEIESDSYEKVNIAAKELGFDPSVGLIGSAGNVYRKYGYNIDDYSSITFDGMIKK